MPNSITFTDLLQQEWTDDVFIEGGILSRRERLLLAAESKAGKSTLILQMIRALACGEPFLGYKITRPLKVLYIQAELKEKRMKDRALPTFSSLPIEFSSNARMWSTKGRVLLDRDNAAIRKEFEEVRPDIGIFDPSLNFHRFDENSSKDMAEFFRALDVLMDDFEASIFVAQHFRKAANPSNGKQKPNSLLEMIRGSSAFRQWPDTTICMEGRTETEFRKLEFETRNADETIHRYIRYNKLTKSFDWYNPLHVIGEWASTFLADKKVTSTQFISEMLKAHGALLSHNKQKAQEMKTALSQTNQILETFQGKFKLISKPE